MTFDRAELLARLQKGRAAFAEVAAAKASLDATYAKGKWTVREILAHLADCEAAFYWRFVRTAAEPGGTVQAFDQDRWMSALQCATRDAAPLLGLFDGVRGAMIALVRDLPQERLDGEATHPERGVLRARQFASLSANHALYHLEQASAAIKGTPWTKTWSVGY
jgi:uncharacterized damage-inducible protein DinB